jgi:formamidopyrimidine-DNA glycosylase
VPELPEVELLTRDLRRWLLHEPVRVEVIDPSVVRGSGPVEGPVPVSRVWRRAKHAVIERGDQALVLHLRMTGKVVPDRPEGRTRVRFHTPGAAYAFQDTRRLGELRGVPLDQVDALFGALGPEPFPDRQNGAWWRAALGSTRKAIKPALLDQHRVAGLGNIAGSEICWRAGVSPLRPVPSLSPREWDALAEHAHAFLHHVVAHEAGQEIHYVSSGGDNPFSVYGRAGAPCPRTGQPIERVVQGGRSTFWCPAAQD